MGADGKLPLLVLHDGEKKAEEEKVARSAQGSPPWMLLLVFGFSITASVAMLFVDSGDSVSEQRSKAEARDSLRRYYAGEQLPLAPYQQRVRLVLQAYQRGDRDGEVRYSREILDMLHAESNNKNMGLTGRKSDPDPPLGQPNDRHLESLLSALLND